MIAYCGRLDRKKRGRADVEGGTVGKVNGRYKRIDGQMDGLPDIYINDRTDRKRVSRLKDKSIND